MNLAHRNPRHRTCWLRCFSMLALFFSSLVLAEAQPAAASGKHEGAQYPFRTNNGNEHLPWYVPKAGEFPPFHSEQRFRGELLSADFVHRTGEFRDNQSGQVVAFSMPPYGTVSCLGNEADLSEAPLGISYLFFVHQDADGRFTRVAAMEDDFTVDRTHNLFYQLDEARLDEGLLRVTQRSRKTPSHAKAVELRVSAETRVWRDAGRSQLTELKKGDELLCNFTGATPTRRCADIWVGKDTHERTKTERKTAFDALNKQRGLPGWIDEVDGTRLTITLFSAEAYLFRQQWLGEFSPGARVKLCVANDELRTWNPTVDGQAMGVVELRQHPVGCFGSGGLRFVVDAGHVHQMLEGFRKNRVVRVFAAAWPVNDLELGHSLMNYGKGTLLSPEFKENVALHYPEQFPFRTDFGNRQLPWYRLEKGVAPPPFSEHLMLGELLRVDAAALTGEFRPEGGGAPVPITFHQPLTLRLRGREAKLADLPLGLRYRFHLYQDEQGAFTRCASLIDEHSRLALNHLTYRIRSIDPASGRLEVLLQHPDVKNYHDERVTPPPFGHRLLHLTAETRLTKNGTPIPPTDLHPGDDVLINLTSEHPSHPARLADVEVQGKK